MALISHTNTVNIPTNRSLTVQLLFDLTPVIAQHQYDYYTPFLVTDHVSLYVEGRPIKSTRALIVGMAVGWAVMFLLTAVFALWYIRRRKGREQKELRAARQSMADLPYATEPLPPLPVAHHLPGTNQYAAVPRTFGSSIVSTSTPPPSVGASSIPTTATGGPATAARGAGAFDALGEYAAANRSFISPELEKKLRDASYFPLDDPDLIPPVTWERRYGVNERELGMLRELYAKNRGWRQTALSG
jgi:hypothetical protein